MFEKILVLKLYDNDSFSDDVDEALSTMYDPKRSHRPDKAGKSLPKTKSKRYRSRDSAAFKQALEKAKEKSTYTKVTNIIKRANKMEIELDQCNKVFKVTIGEEVFCTCTPSQRADRKICSHVLWTYINVFKLEESNPLIARVSFLSHDLRVITIKCPSAIPEELKQCLKKDARKYHEKLKSHEKFRCGL